MKYQDNNPTQKIHARYAKFGEISSKFGLSGVYATPHTQCAAPSQCAAPEEIYTGFLLPVHRTTCSMCHADLASSNFTQFHSYAPNFLWKVYSLLLGMQMNFSKWKISHIAMDFDFSFLKPFFVMFTLWPFFTSNTNYVFLFPLLILA